MNLNQLTPDNNGASKVNQSKVVLRLLFKANKQLGKTVKKGMSDFDYPASGLEVWIALYFFALLTSGTDMGSVMTLLNGLGTARITSIQTKILRILLTDGWTGNDDVVQRFFQELEGTLSARRRTLLFAIPSIGRMRQTRTRGSRSAWRTLQRRLGYLCDIQNTD